jgi:hypothetical protein
MEHDTEDSAASSQPAKITWDQVVRHFFTHLDVTCMFGVSAGAIELNNHDSVKRNAPAILGQVEAGNMPPAHSGEPPWPPERVKMFKDWIAAGCH